MLWNCWVSVLILSLPYGVTQNDLLNLSDHLVCFLRHWENQHLFKCQQILTKHYPGPQWMRRSQACHWKRESTEQKRRVWYLLLEWINPQKSPCCWCSPGHSLVLSGFLMCKVEIQGPLLQGVKCLSSPCPAEVTDFRQLGLRSCCYLLLLCL